MRADRLISILMLLQTRGQMTAQDLAERLEVSERTIYRDLDALSVAGVPVYAERGPGGGCSLLDSYRTNLTGLTEDELRALFMLSVPSPLDDLGVSKTLASAQLKLSAALSANRRTDIDHVRRRIYLDSAEWFRPQEAVPFLEQLQEAVWQDRRVMIVYRRGDGDWVKRLIEPYGLVAKTSIWYLVGLYLRGMNVYRVSRIQELSLSEATFERLADFDLGKYWTDWVRQFETTRPQYPVTLRVSEQFVPSLVKMLGEGIWPVIDQADAPDEHGWLTVIIPFDSLEAARTHALGFGNMAEVLKPAELRQSVIDYATRVLTTYTLNS